MVMMSTDMASSTCKEKFQGLVRRNQGPHNEYPRYCNWHPKPQGRNELLADPLRLQLHQKALSITELPAAKFLQDL
jgi:hypothetical protein